MTAGTPAGSAPSGRLAGKTVIVTGAGSQGDGVGNGHAMAVTMARQGASVLCVDNVAERAQAVVEEITAAGGRAAAHAIDVRDPTGAAGMVSEARARFGQLSGLVCNVGIGGSTTVLDPPDPDPWHDVLDVNVNAVVLGIRAAAPELVAAGGGSVVTVGSTGSMRYYNAGVLAYATSKAALNGLVMAVAGELGPYRVRANNVVVGPVWSPMLVRAAARMPDPEGYRVKRRGSTLLPDEGTPWDVADAVAFLISDESRWITGQSLVVDGGATLTMR